MKRLLAIKIFGFLREGREVGLSALIK